MAAARLFLERMMADEVRNDVAPTDLGATKNYEIYFSGLPLLVSIPFQCHNLFRELILSISLLRLSITMPTPPVRHSKLRPVLAMLLMLVASTPWSLLEFLVTC